MGERIKLSIRKYLNACCMSGTYIGDGDSEVNKTSKNPFPHVV